jgi:hypothetical protein
MSQNPQKRNKDSKEAAEDSIEQSIGNEDITSTESLEVADKEEEEKGYGYGRLWSVIDFNFILRINDIFSTILFIDNSLGIALSF